MLLRAPAPRPGFRVLTFELPGDHPAGRIRVVGTFNAWTPGADPFVADGAVQRVTVTVPADAEVSFRYLGEHGWWFDERQADWIDDRGSHVAPEPAPAVAAEAEPAPARVLAADPAPGTASPKRAEGHATLSPAEYAVHVAEKRRRKAEKAARKAAKKAREKAAKAAEKQRKGAEKAARIARRAIEDARDERA